MPKEFYQESLLLYRRGLISLGRAAELTGLTEREMASQARILGIAPLGSRDLADEELQ